MVSKARNIATFLGRTDSANPTELRLLHTGELTGVDSDTVRSINGAQFFETLDSLPVSNLREGQQAFVNESKRLYVSNGSGYYNALTVNNAPFWDSVPLDEYTIVDSATPLIVKADPGDSDGLELFINQSFGSDSAQFMATVTNDSSVFTFTPKTKAEIESAVTAGNLTNANGDFTYTFKWSDGINFVAKAANIIYNTSVGGSANTSVAYRGYNQGTFGSWGNSTASKTLGMPYGTQEGDQAILVIGGMGWTAAGASSAISFPNNEFTLTQEYNWGYNVGQYAYRTNRYTCSSITSDMISNGVVVNNDNPGANTTDYKLMTLITLGGGNTPLFNHAQINYASSYTTGSNYGSYSAARPSGYATKNGIMEVLTTRYGTRTMINYGNSQVQGYVDRSIYYLQAFYKNSSSGLLDQPGHGWTHNGGTVYSASSLVIAY